MASSITAEQVFLSLLAIPAFIPLLVCPGYLTGWFGDLQGFRTRSLVERIFWSVPLSVAVSTISSVLIGRFFSIDIVAGVFSACSVAFVGVLGYEFLQVRRAGTNWRFGWKPYGSTSLVLAILWIAIAIWSLVDFQKGDRLFTSLFTFDHSFRVSWTESILRTGVPPENPLYLYKRPVPMRNYYFWYVVCAVVARLSHLSVRAVFNASCIWSGFAFTALIGLYLKHFLNAGVLLRKRFVLATILLAVTGLDIFPYLWEIIFLHQPPHGDLDLWSKDPLYSWYAAFLWVPHHIVGLVCCMFAFLLAWLAEKGSRGKFILTLLCIGSALGSAFGLSIFVSFGFFLLMLTWGVWQIAVEKQFRPAMLLAAGGAIAVVLLVPYLMELTHTSSTMQGGRVFGFGIREMIPPEILLDSPLFKSLAAAHPGTARNLANLVLLVPGYTIELGFYLVVFVVCLNPALRGRLRLAAAERSLMFIAIATIPFISFLRSWVLNSNDFGWRAAALLQFPLLLFASGLLVDWDLARYGRIDAAGPMDQPQRPRRWVWLLSSSCLVIGLAGTFAQALVIRYFLPFTEVQMLAHHYSPNLANFSHNSYISAVGYEMLDRSIPRDAVVQFNPNHPNYVATVADEMGVDRQTVIAGDEIGCGSELGGDPRGCPGMAAAIDRLYINGSKEEARAVCRQLGIQYLVARTYDRVWSDKQSWVWTLSAVVPDTEFRGLDCR